MRLLVCGGRAFADAALFERRMAQVDAAYRITCVIEGESPGADLMAREWAKRNRREHMAFHAQWGQFGARAGPMRNRTMLLVGEPDLVLAFPGGRGTANMVEQAGRAGVTVWWA